MMSHKRPLEFYGHNVESTQDWNTVLTSQHCPYLDRRCVKQRKSDPQQTIGACILGFKQRRLIVCPHRFLQRNQTFLDVVPLLSGGERFFVVPEIPMPGGNVDYFVVAERDGAIVDFAGLEIQSLDTTGSGGIWAAREALSAGELGIKYGYGINWKMSAKTILMQLHHKVGSFEALAKKLVLVTQTEFFDYITREFQSDHIHSAASHDAMHFHLYNCVPLNYEYQIILSTRQSTDARGIERILSLGRPPEISEGEVIARIRAKMPNALRLTLDS
ncbi:MAG: hypothetical protein E3J21_15240 [Anaerolineales bacterium]|nr:MAG: hypothetical protein E3J21_15240 [Anaerolineales bacterium]